MRFIENFRNLIISYLHLNLFYGDTINNRGWDNWRPFLCFDYTITTNQFHSTNYKKPLSKDRIRLHEEIMNLHNKGWGYTKIHRHLIKNEFKINNAEKKVIKIATQVFLSGFSLRKNEPSMADNIGAVAIIIKVLATFVF